MQFNDIFDLKGTYFACMDGDLPGVDRMYFDDLEDARMWCGRRHGRHAIWRARDGRKGQDVKVETVDTDFFSTVEQKL